MVRVGGNCRNAEEALMAIVAGFDVHRRQITFDALDTETGEVSRGRISSDVRPGRVRLAAVVAVAAVVAAIIAERIPSERLLGVAFTGVSILLAIAAVTILRRVIIGATQVDFRTILGAVSGRSPRRLQLMALGQKQGLRASQPDRQRRRLARRCGRAVPFSAAYVPAAMAPVGEMS
jgi:hypothetical protein